jgi:hypothetical protein
MVHTLPSMTIPQRVILCMGCNTIIWIWVHPPVYKIADDIRLEHNLYYAWEVPMDWSVNLPMVALRLLTVVLVTTGFFLAFRSSKKKEGA